MPRSFRALLASFALVLLAAVWAAPSAQAAPVVEIDAKHGPTNFTAGENGELSFFVRNYGDTVAAAPVTLKIDLPPGVTTRLRGSQFYGPRSTFSARLDWVCPTNEAADASSVTCTHTGTYFPGDEGGPVPRGLGLGGALPSSLRVYVKVAPGTSGPLLATATVSTAAGEVVETESIPLGEQLGSFGLDPGSVFADAFAADGSQERQAGSHPSRAVAAFGVLQHNELERNRNAGADEMVPMPLGKMRNIVTDLPRGFVGNPRAVAQCTVAQLVDTTDIFSACPAESQVGIIDYTIDGILGPGGHRNAVHAPVWNVAPPKGVLADFAFAVAGNPVHVLIELDPRDNSVIARVSNLNDFFWVFDQRLTIWGVPADPIHDAERAVPNVESYGIASSLPPRPLLNLPTRCNVFDKTGITLDSWEHTGTFVGPYPTEPIAVSGCNQVEFEPKVQIRPTTNLADAPTGLEFDMHIPQNEDPEGLATAHLRDAVVKLPAGMTVNPPSANGLRACSIAEVGIGADGASTATTLPNGRIFGTPVTCPDASKLGTVEAVSPAVDHPLNGTVYLAEQNTNPFGSLLAMYLVIEDPDTGVLVKLPGKVDPDPNTGQLTATFRNNPQLPVEDLHLEFFQGPRAALKTPSACGVHTTEATLTPWSSPEGADVSSPSSFELVGGPAGGSCLPSGGSAPNSPAFTAGTEDPTAKAFSPFTMKLTRADGSQQLKSLEMTLPKGLVGKLAGIPYCSDAALSSAAGKSGRAEKDSSSCSSASQVGSVNVGVGAGSTPLYVQGKAYLAGPYKGAPLSMAIVTPAVAGPFDLGTVVVRAALHVDPDSAQVKAVSDEIPTILQGIPLNVRSIALKADKPEFILNPTSCDPMKVEGSSTSVFGQGAGLSNPFQVGDCGLLAFKPQLTLNLKGGTKRAQYPALTALLTARPGDANIGFTSVALPSSAFLAQNHIRTICTRVQFAADQCPAGSVYGKATAWTPLLDQPLSGNVYLRSSSNPLPDMVVALKGQIDFNLVGRIDSFKKGIRTTFDTVPDAPVSKFLLQMEGGKKGLILNSRNLCKSVNKATVQMTAQNGMVLESKPELKAKCPKQKKAKKKAKKRAGKPGKKG